MALQDHPLGHQPSMAMSSKSSHHTAADATPKAGAGLDEITPLRDLKPKNKLRTNRDSDYFRRIARVQGTVVCAKNLPNTDTWSKSDPYCVVKGIRSNNHLVDIFVTKTLMNTLAPHWAEDFKFVCPESWGLVELVGLKFLVYDADERYASFTGSDDFLGGADVDLSEFFNGKSTEFERELDGGPRKSSNSKLFKQKKPRLTLKITIFHEFTIRPVEFSELLLRSLDTFTRVRQLDCHVVKAKHLPNKDVRSRSDPQCIVRAVTLTGSVRELYRTAVVRDSLDPVWHERFHAKFAAGEEPLVLVFDVFDDDDGTDSTVSGEHLGSAMVPIMDFAETSKRKLELLGDSQLLEALLNKEGVSTGTYAEAVHMKEKLTRPTGAFWKLKRLLTAEGRSSLTVECSLDSCPEEMPHAVFMRLPQEIREESDVAPVLPSWQHSMFGIPREIVRFQNGERGHPGSLCARDRVMFVCGIVHGASALPSADTSGKSDPFCIVEGVSNHGKRLFIHRTRCILHTLSPAWHEGFFLAVPQDAVINKLTFSVYDSDETNLPAMIGDDDDFLGNATIDLCYVMNKVKLHEEIPLVGAKRGHKLGVKSSFSNGFRRSASISVEVYAERRVEPYFEKYANYVVDNWSPRARHMISRKPAALGYADMSQNELEGTPVAPAKVLHLHMTNQLLHSAKRNRRSYSQWLQHPPGRWHSIANASLTAPPSSQPLPSSPNSAAAPDTLMELEQKQEGQEAPQRKQELYDFSFLKRPPSLPQAASLPDLHTHVGRLGAARSLAPDATWLTGLQFRGDFESIAAALTQDMLQKPPVQAVAQIHCD